MRLLRPLLLFTNGAAAAASSAVTKKGDIDDSCWKYAVSDVVEVGSTIEAKLDFAGGDCSFYGPKVPHLKLLVEYQGGRSMSYTISVFTAANFTDR
jgi:hypothetical protein